MRRTPDQWQKVMDQFASCGKTQEQFCKDKGIALPTFALWRRKLKAASLTPAPATFVQLHLPSTADPAPSNCTEPADLVVELPYGVVLRFRGLGQ